jgi:hypothetical protein
VAHRNITLENVPEPQLDQDKDQIAA